MYTKRKSQRSLEMVDGAATISARTKQCILFFPPLSLLDVRPNRFIGVSTFVVGKGLGNRQG